MAAIMESSRNSLFISFAPGTGSSALEMFLRTKAHDFKNFGISIKFFPEEEFGVGATISRHCTYREFNKQTGIEYNNVATGVRDAFSYYYAEYNRIKKKWSLLLTDKHSWIYNEESKSTLELVQLAKETDNFDQWFYKLMVDSKQSNHYMTINGNHLDMTNIFLRCEHLSEDFVAMTNRVFDLDLPERLLQIEYTNVTERDDPNLPQMSINTKALYEELFGHYLGTYIYNR